MKKGSKITIKEVAAAARVSVTTVSCVLNGDKRYSQETVDKVWEAANQLYYTPCSVAKSFRNGKDSTKHNKSSIIMFITRIGSDTPMGDNYHQQRATLVQWLAQQRGLFTIPYLYCSKSVFKCPPLLDNLVDGAIVAMHNASVLETVRGKCPVVLIDTDYFSHLKVPQINANLPRGFAQMVQLLHQSGHRNIAFLYSTYVFEDFSPEMVKAEMMKNLLREYGFKLTAETDLAIDINRFNNDAALAEVTRTRIIPLIEEKKITCVLSVIDNYAEAVYRHLAAAGIKVPDDISLCSGFRIHLGDPENQITTMKYDWDNMIEGALDLLAETIENPDAPPQVRLVDMILHQGKTLKNLNG